MYNITEKHFFYKKRTKKLSFIFILFCYLYHSLKETFFPVIIIGDTGDCFVDRSNKFSVQKEFFTQCCYTENPSNCLPLRGRGMP